MDQNFDDTLDYNIISKSRVETIVDGIYAIAMTLLVMNMLVPVFAEPVTNKTILRYLISLIPQFANYFISFFLLTNFWRIHHKIYDSVDHITVTLVRLNMLYLMFLVLVPFSTSLNGNYGYIQVAAIFFHVNMLIMGLFNLYSWYYIISRNLNHNRMSAKQYNYSLDYYLFLPALTIIAIIITFISPIFSSIPYLGMLFVRYYRKKLVRECAL